eukprot:277908_1
MSNWLRWSVQERLISHGYSQNYIDTALNAYEFKHGHHSSYGEYNIDEIVAIIVSLQNEDNRCYNTNSDCLADKIRQFGKEIGQNGIDSDVLEAAVIDNQWDVVFNGWRIYDRIKQMKFKTIMRRHFIKQARSTKSTYASFSALLHHWYCDISFYVGLKLHILKQRFINQTFMKLNGLLLPAVNITGKSLYYIIICLWLAIWFIVGAYICGIFKDAYFNLMFFNKVICGLFFMLVMVPLVSFTKNALTILQYQNKMNQLLICGFTCCVFFAVIMLCDFELSLFDFILSFVVTLFFIGCYSIDKFTILRN